MTALGDLDRGTIAEPHAPELARRSTSPGLEGRLAVAKQQVALEL